MALNVVLVTQKQSGKGLLLSWSSMEGVASYQAIIATRKLSAEELEAAVASGGTAECTVVKLGADATAIVDDCSPEGDTHFYGVVMNFSDGAPRSARFKFTPDGGTPGVPTLSSKGVKKFPKATAPAAAPAPSAVPGAAAAPRPAAPAGSSAPSASPTGNTGAYRVAGAAAPSSAGTATAGAVGAAVRPPAANPSLARPAAGSPSGSASPTGNTGAFKIGNSGAPAPVSPPAEDPLEAQRRREVRAKIEADKAAAEKAAQEKAAAEKAAADKAAADALEARKKQQAAARGAREVLASDEPVPPPSQFPLEESFSFHMSGGTQTWDGLRLYWERETTAVAYEILVSDHQIFGDELSDAIAGKADFTSCTAVHPSVRAVIDNITPREARGWYLVLVRDKAGKRSPHPFQIGDAAESGKADAPFVNPNRTGELRAEIEGMLGDAREQWDRWKRDQDVGARHEAQRLIRDALLMYPNHPAASELAVETG